MQPETKYARPGGDRIADQVFGDGPPDLVLTFPAPDETARAGAAGGQGLIGA